MWRHTADTPRLAALWPSLLRAIRWCIRNANGTDGYGLPQYLTNTYDHTHRRTNLPHACLCVIHDLPRMRARRYDHFFFERRRAVAYNAHIYVTALQAARRIALALHDTPATIEIAAALELSRAALVDPSRLWNATGRFFRAKTPAGHGERPATPATRRGDSALDAPTSTAAAAEGGRAGAEEVEEEPETVEAAVVDDSNQIMTDTLYGQMLHHHLMDGTYAINASYLSAHLSAEWAANHDTYGMRPPPLHSPPLHSRACMPMCEHV